MIYRERKSPRASRYDYSSPGAYFITICTQDRFDYFWKITNDVMKRNWMWDVADICRVKIPEIFPHISIDNWIVMPNHMHGILIMDDIPWWNENENRRDGITGHPLETDILDDATFCFDGTRRDRVPTVDENVNTKPKPKWPPRWSLWYIINQYKWSVTREINKSLRDGMHELPKGFDIFKRQSRYYDNIIRNDNMYNNIKDYIHTNPEKRSEDRFNLQ